MATRKTTDYIIIHCAATRPSMNTDIKDIDRWHRERNFRSVGYHYFIRRDGLLQTGRPLMESGAHAVGYNERSIGVCMAGGVAEDGKTPENNFTPAQWATLRGIVSALTRTFPQARVIGHRDVANKVCPSFDAKAWWKKNQT